MQSLFGKLFLLLGMCFGCWGVSLADAPEEHFKYVNYSISYTLESDASYTATIQWSAKALDQRGIESLRKATIWHSTRVEEVTDIQANTLKEGGINIKVRPDSYQIETNTGMQSQNPAFSDRTRITIIFPELEKGDVVALKYNIKLKEPIFPGHFSVAHQFPREVAYDNVTIKANWPESLKLRYSFKEMSIDKEESRRRNSVTLKYSNPSARSPLPPQAYAIYRPEDSPGVAFTTFSNYEEISSAYGARAIPKAVPTEAVHQQVVKILPKNASEIENIRAIYEWVSQNIEYAGNCVGVGVVVPRDLDFVLSNRMGDCKDHATLLQAMLSAAGIKSNQVLVNAGLMYHLPALPVSSYVNHVFTYVPSIDMFLDSTSEDTPFGYLPYVDQDKPVLHVGASHPKKNRTPGTPPGKNQQSLHLQIELNENGSGVGHMQVALKGEFAAQMRPRFKNWPLSEQKKYVRESLKAMRLRGDGNIQFDNADQLTDQFSYVIQFKVEGLFEPQGGVLPVGPLFNSPFPVSMFLHSLDTKEADYDGSCHNGSTTEEYKINLPSNIKIISKPNDASMTTPYLDYSQSFNLNGDQLVVKRVLADKSPQGYCSATVLRTYNEASDKALRMFKLPVIYQAKSQ